MCPSKPLSVVLLAGALAFVAVWPADAQGQHARPRSSPAIGRAVHRSAARPPYRPSVGYHSYRPYYYRPYAYSHYYGPSYYWPYYGTPFGLSLSFGYPGYYYGGGYPGYYYGGGYPGYSYGGGYPAYDAGEGQSLGGIRFLVKPKQAEIYVDDQYAGIVDDFDGSFQKLSLPPGEHKIELYLDGYRTVHQTVYVQPDSTLKVSYQMQPLAPGETNEPRPTPPPEAPAPQPTVAPPSPPPPMGVRAQPGEFGTLSVRVQPADAEILVDGEPWHGPGDTNSLMLQLAAGTHRVEVKKDGCQTFSADVEVRAGETTPLNVSILQRQAS